MSDHDRIELLQARLREMQLRTLAPWERPIAEVARRAIESELTEVGRRLLRRAWGLPRPPHGCAA